MLFFINFACNQWIEMEKEFAFAKYRLNANELKSNYKLYEAPSVWLKPKCTIFSFSNISLQFLKCPQSWQHWRSTLSDQIGDLPNCEKWKFSPWQDKSQLADELTRLLMASLLFFVFCKKKLLINGVIIQLCLENCQVI